MKPTPTKVVLLMSAAGLGMSWSGLALASRDNGAAPSMALTFGVSPRGEPGCESQHTSAWASCLAADGELLQTIVANASLPLPMQSTTAIGNGKVSIRVFDAHATADERSGTAAPASAAGVKLTPAESASVEQVLASLAEVLGSQVEAPATGFAATPAPDAPDQQLAPRAAVAPETAEPPVGKAKLAFQAFDAYATASAARREVAVAAARVAIDPSGDRQADAAHDALGKQRSGAAPSVVAGILLTPAEAVSVEQALASLASVLDAQIEESATGLAASPAPSAAPEQQVAQSAAVAPKAAEPPQLATAASIGAPRDDNQSLVRAREADDIVVASSHSDKILMSLEALRSGAGPDSGRLGAQTKKTVVVRHADKVLETLALFQSKKSQQTAFACTSEPKEWAAQSQLAGMEAELDILLDLPTAVQQPVEAALHAAPVISSEHAMGDARERSALGADLVALNADTLDEVRGGFVTDGGLKISFGIERAVYLNGNLVTTTSLNIADLSKIAGGQAHLTGNLAGNLALLQSGTGNIFSPGSISTTAAGTVIQNTLDNQKINTITRIDAAVNSSGVMRSINLQSSMQSAIVNSLRR